MVSSSRRLLAAVLPLLALALSLPAISPASADGVVVKNSLKPPVTIGVECPPLQAGAEGEQLHGAVVVVPPGSKATVALPAGLGAGGAPPSGYACEGSWEEVGGVVRFTVYSYARDHGWCGGGSGGKGRCAVDIRSDGVYAWDAAATGWVRVQEIAYRLLGAGGHGK